MHTVAIIKLGSTTPEIADRMGDFEDWFIAGISGKEISVEVVDVPGGDRLPDPSSVSGAILTGSHDMVTDAPDWNEPVTQWIRRAAAMETPLLGVCYGHQLLAAAFGGLVGDHPDGREFGTVEIQLTPGAEKDALMNGMPTRFRAHACHRQSVLKLPPGAVRLAGSAHDPHQAFSMGRAAWGVQFHPEFSEAAVREYIRSFADDLLAEGVVPDRLLASTAPTRVAAGLLARFVDLAVTRRR